MWRALALLSGVTAISAVGCTHSAAELPGAPGVQRRAVTAADLGSGLAAYWKLDADGSDSAGNGVHLTQRAGTTPGSFPAGKLGQGYSAGFVGWFADPSIGQLESAPRPELDFSGDFTFSAWVYRAPNPAADDVWWNYGIFSNDQVNLNVDSWGAYPTPAYLTLHVSNHGTQLGSVQTTALDFRSAAGTNTWIHVVGFRRGTTIGVRVNGQETTAELSGAVGDQGRFYFASNGGGYRWQGTTDEAAKWSRALSAAELDLLYNGGAGTRPAPLGGQVETVWVDDTTPRGAALHGDAEGWSWVSGNPAPFAGTVAHQSAIVAGLHQHHFDGAQARLPIATGDALFAWVYLDPANVPQEVMLQFNDGSWEHRAYWGANSIGWGADGTSARRYMGPLPAPGQWVRLRVPASLVGLEGHTLNGMAFTLSGGRATWDRAGKLGASCDGLSSCIGALCGNGTVEPGEACDDVCCSTTCTGFAAAGTVCRPAAGLCDVAETCTGTSAACPADALAAGPGCPGPFVGSGAGGGSGAVCLATYDFPVVAGRSYTISTCGSNSGDTYLKVTGACECENDDTCGLGSACTCVAAASGTATICASSYGGADASWSYVIAGDCGLPGTVCRPAASECDIPDHCDGVSAACPDTTVPDGQGCSMGGTCGGGQCQVDRVYTDSSWRAIDREEPSWTDPAYDDGGWSSATDEGGVDGGPWGWVGGMPDNTPARWVWLYDSTAADDYYTGWFRRKFTPRFSAGVLHVTADNAYDAYLNGALVGRGDDWPTAGKFPVGLHGHGNNVLAIRAENWGGPGGVVVDLTPYWGWCGDGACEEYEQLTGCAVDCAPRDLAVTLSFTRGALSSGYATLYDDWYGTGLVSASGPDATQVGYGYSGESVYFETYDGAGRAPVVAFNPAPPALQVYQDSNYTYGWFTLTGPVAVTVHLGACGDGGVDPSEQCDLGAQNGAPGSCCSASCTLVAAGTVCRAAAGPCDVAETCRGTSAACPADAFVAGGTVCRAAAGVCDVAETCTGASAACPADVKVATFVVCRAAAGECDTPERCDGINAACPADAKGADGTACTDTTPSDCYKATCQAGNCSQTAAFQPTTVVCRAAAGPCDVAETCTGSSGTCPPDLKAATGVVCRPAAGPCDRPEYCNGTTITCPADAKYDWWHYCIPPSPCSYGQVCHGGDECQPEVLLPAGTVCRAAMSACDAQEVCDGVHPTCPADARFANADDPDCDSDPCAN
ncbi:MAG TPA: LamG-like jellyroll fold domain-containing protein [Polyangia bacterium]|jgi:hypothetical protein